MKELAAQDGNWRFEMNVERIDYAARARERLEGALRKVGPDPAPPDASRQRRAIAQQAFLMTRKAVEKSRAQQATDSRQAAAREWENRRVEQSKQRQDHDRDEGQDDRRRGSGLDIVV